MNLRTAIIANAIVISVLLCSTGSPSTAQSRMPDSSGVSGYVLISPGVIWMDNSFIESGPPLMDPIGEYTIDDIRAHPPQNQSGVLAFAGEVNYTFGSSRTQLFFGNRLEDILRLDVSFGLGVRQELPDKSVLAASVLATPLTLKHWEDPYVEGEPRIKTKMNAPGARLRYGSAFGTGLELTLTWRAQTFETERSGAWLAAQGRINESERAQLIREGNLISAMAMYHIKLGRHNLLPAIRFYRDDREGKAVSSTRFDGKLTYIYRSPGILVDINLVAGARDWDAVHPAYGEIVSSTRVGGAFIVVLPVARFWNGAFSVVAGAELLEENATVDFFDTSIRWLNAGISWRHLP